MTLETVDSRTVSIEEAARALGIGRNLAYGLAKSGRFPVPLLRLGRLYRVPKIELARLLGNGSEGGVP